MKIYTTYFSNLKNLREDLYPIAISRTVPRGMRICRMLELAPSTELLWAYKNGEISQRDYTIRYQREVLDKLNPEEVRKTMGRLSGGRDVVLVCWEKDEKACHRVLASLWLSGCGEYTNETYLLNMMQKREDELEFTRDRQMYLEGI